MTDSALVTYAEGDARASIRSDLASMEATLESVLPAMIDRDRFVAVAAKAIIENPKVLACTRVSILSALHEAAQLGLEPSGLLGSAYLVPYQRKVVVTERRGDRDVQVERRVMVAQLIPGYRGLIDLARRSGEIEAIWANVVHLRDAFRVVQGSSPHIEHEPFVADPRDPPEERDRGPIIGAYMIARLRGTSVEQNEWMPVDEIEVVRRSSRAKDDGPWITHYGEMARKSVVRRGSKYLPLTPLFSRALELDEEAERVSVSGPDVPTPTPAQRILQRRAESRGGTSSLPALTAPEDVQDGPETRDDAESTPDSAHAQTESSDSPQDRANPGPDPEETPETGDRASPAPAPLCGHDGGIMGTCERRPRHSGAHRNGEYAWPADTAPEPPHPARG